VYVVLKARVVDGVNVAMVAVLSSEVFPAIEAPLGSLSANVTDDAVTAWLKVALGVTEAATPVAPEAGDVELTAGAGGGAAVVKLHV
jgi:hypothetical protein